MIKAVIDTKSKKVISYHGTDREMVVVEMDELPKPPESPKVGVNYVEYFNEQTRKIELREEERPLTLEERLINAERKAEASMEAIAEMYEQGN